MARRGLSVRATALLLSFILRPHVALGQTIPLSYLDARTLALAGTAPSRTSGARALWANPAALASPETTWSAVVGAARPFGLGDLTTGGLAVARSRASYGIGVGVATFGSDAYRETAMVVGFGARPVPFIRLGVSTHLTGITVPGYGPSYLFAVSCGALVPATRSVIVSFVGASLASLNRGDLLLVARRSYSVGAEYEATDRVHVGGLIAREEGNRWSSGVGLSIEPHPWFTVCLGRTSGPSSFTGGCEIRTRFGHISYGVRFHRELDPTHAVTFAFQT